MNPEIEEIEWNAYVHQKRHEERVYLSQLNSQFPYMIEWPLLLPWPDVINWCNENFGARGEYWDFFSGKVYFTEEKNCTLFLLRWS